MEEKLAQKEGLIRELASEWAADYERKTGNALVEIELGTYTYIFDTTAERLVCVWGHSIAREGPRDANRQRGHPSPPEGDHKGHVIAHSVGGGMDINIVPQSAAVNLGKRWREIEKLAAKNPGTAIAVRLIYADDSDRPAAFDYGFDDPAAGFQVRHFDNTPPH